MKDKVYRIIGMKDKVYNILKWVAITGIPILVGLIAAVLPELKVDESTVISVVKIISAIGIALAGWLGVSSYNHNKPNPKPDEDVYMEYEQHMPEDE